MGGIRHIVWDWNGTLLDDTALTVRAANAALAAIGHPIELTVERWREVATRPIYDTYHCLTNSDLGADQWAQVGRVWLATYLDGLPEVGLNPTAEAALDEAAALGWTQSIVSLHQEEALRRHVTELGIADRFTEICGSGANWIDGRTKADSVAAQLAALDLRPHQALMIGDMEEDAVEAVRAGAAPVLVPTGDTSRQRLDATGYPVAETLIAAVRLGAREAVNGRTNLA